MGIVGSKSSSSSSSSGIIGSKKEAVASAPKGGPEQKIERIRHEDAGSRIDELRVGGETKHITVSPKGSAPAYEVPPESNNRNPAGTERERSGSGGWKILGF